MRRAWWATLALLGCDGANDGPCVDDTTFFREQLWPEVVQPVCMGCHTAEGAAAASDLVFASTARPDHLDVDALALARVAGLARDGTSILLLKPLGQEGHGGGAVISEDSEAFALLQAFVARQEAPVTCPDAEPVDPAAGLVLMDPAATLRKASLLLTGALPDDDAVASVRAGGEPALREALAALMDRPAFANLLVERFNDLFLTDRYRLGRDGLGLLDEDDWPSAWWFEDAYDDDAYDVMYERSSDAVAREPLELLAHIVREGLPFTELVTADYTMVNAYSAASYGVSDAWPDPRDPAALAFYPATLPGWPHAGVLSTPAWVNRYPTTDTNRNRHRAWKVLKTFLATDVLSFSERPLDPTATSVHNPTLNDPQCTVCHATLDPIAGTFKDFDVDGRFAPPAEGWYPDMRPPGYAEVPLPVAEAGLPWLGRHIADDPRFALATVRNLLTLLVDAELLHPSAVRDPDLRHALAWQDAFIDEVATGFRASGHDLRFAIEQIVLSPWFRAIGDDGADPAVAARVGLARWLTPEELDRKIVATLGVPWGDPDDRRLREEYALLYGGIDSFSVTQRLRAPNGVMGAIGLRMATEMACAAVPADLALPAGQRRLLPLVEADWEPLTNAGFAVPEVEAAMRANLVHLHARLLGERLAVDDPEIDASWTLLVDTFAEGREAIRDDLVDDRLPSTCQLVKDPWTGASLPDDRRVQDDPDYVIRAWMAVVSYLLSDHRFLSE